ncbi:putative helicase mov-10-B.1 isoform X2 [Mercenaria mercenaria]|uniref:putative helicase mov-10-B.1 isoform X2 n=1 Tax=Mercenaria mercenaria TaxID=6596 RepID=UPI00234E9179|nr:putative helicase mov-10-B.1 isoform X2 [Mercenaria mercenaria]
MWRRNRTGPGEEVMTFIKYLNDNNYPVDIKRDDLKTIYEGKFVDVRRAAVPGYVKVKYRDILLYLRRRKLIHELGDYYSFGKDVQGLYENLIGSEEHRKTLEEWKEKAACTPYFCEVCGVQCPGEKDFDQHKNGTRHRIHKFHYEIFRNRFLFLWDTGVFKLLQKDNRRPARLRVHIPPGKSYDMLVKCKAPVDFGHHFVPLAFYFEWKDRHNQTIQDTVDQQTQEFVLRFVSVHVLGDLHAEMAPTAPFRFPDQIPDSIVDEIVPGEPCTVSGKSLLECKLTPCRVPSYLKPQVMKGLTGKRDIINESLRRVLACDLSPENYRSKFDTLLWTEELQMEDDIRRYDLIGVEMQLDRHSRLMVLEVPGLMERRPSVMRNDKVYIFVHGDRKIRYDAHVHRVELNDVHLGVGRKLKDAWIPKMKYDIRFDFARFNLWVQHRALTQFQYAETILFASERSTFSPREERVPMKPWYDRKLNPEQTIAVTNIVQGTSRPGPYLIFGPPGTGKTVTVTEAIRQVYHCQPDAKILACCPENTASDFLMKKLINPQQPGVVNKREIFRMYAVSRPYISVPQEIKDSKQLNYDDEERDFFYPAKTELKKYRILVMTLSTTGRLVSASFPRNFFTHIFIDEGAHAIEPECIIPITGLLDARTQDCGQLVIAGDPKQLGPILRSPFALNYGLETSVLERFMDTISEYHRLEISGYNSNYVTKLIRNYRSHDAIIHVPRELFYDGVLDACGDRMILEAMLGWEHLPNKEFPVIFHSVFGNDEREESSPSFFNRDEISQVEKYLDLLLTEKKGGLKIKAKDIGIISPYRKQVEKIRKMVEKKKYGTRDEKIMVGSVEEFQGQECKIIIISTVRSNANYVQIDLDYHLGFVKNPKRFNVALTRARSLLIVIGNPLVLEKDVNWKRFLDYCDGNGGFKGQHGKLKPDSTTGESNSGDIGDVYNRLASMRLQSEDPEWEIRD